MKKKIAVIDSFSGPYRFLSNFYPARILMDCFEYPTLEHAYQAAKTRNRFERDAIRAAKTPGEARRLGRKIVHLAHDWDSVKVNVMKELVRQKFSKEPFRQWLLDTGNAVLVEGNRHGDTFWGVCRGKGENRLGVIIMELRDELRKQDSH